MNIKIEESENNKYSAIAFLIDSFTDEQCNEDNLLVQRLYNIFVVQFSTAHKLIDK